MSHSSEYFIFIDFIYSLDINAAKIRATNKIRKILDIAPRELIIIGNERHPSAAPIKSKKYN